MIVSPDMIQYIEDEVHKNRNLMTDEVIKLLKEKFGVTTEEAYMIIDDWMDVDF